MTIIATGNPSLLKPGCPCCAPGECVCHVILTYNIRGLSASGCEVPTLAAAWDCHGDAHSEPGAVNAWFNTGDTVHINADNAVHCVFANGVEMIANFTEWRVTRIYVEPGTQEEAGNNATYRIPYALAHVPLGNTEPCGFIACAMYDVEELPGYTYAVGASCVSCYIAQPSPNPSITWEVCPTISPEGQPVGGAFRYAFTYHGGPSTITCNWPTDHLTRSGIVGCEQYLTVDGVFTSGLSSADWCAGVSRCTGGLSHTQGVSCFCDYGTDPSHCYCPGGGFQFHRWGQRIWVPQEEPYCPGGTIWSPAKPDDCEWG